MCVVSPNYIQDVDSVLGIVGIFIPLGYFQFIIHIWIVLVGE